MDDKTAENGYLYAHSVKITFQSQKLMADGVATGGGGGGGGVNL